LGEEKVLWNGRPTVLAFIDMLVGVPLLMVFKFGSGFPSSSPVYSYF
jgi:hypothetical protein